ncbi:hypothetical protein B7463_g5885, partial [Scytalidium lignicola]
MEKLEGRVASMEETFRQFLQELKSGELRDSLAARKDSPALATPGDTEDGASITAQPDALIASSAASGFLEDEDNEHERARGAEEESQTLVKDEVSYRHCYADGFGELDPDINGQLRYVGLGSTASIVDRCIGLRQHINTGLKKKGYDIGEPFLTSPAAVIDVEVPPQPLDNSLRQQLPPQTLVDILIETYVEQVYFIFPIISKSDVLVLYDELLGCDNFDAGVAGIFSAVMAVAAPLIPQRHAVFNDIDEKYSYENIGSHFYTQAIHFLNLSQRIKSDRRGILQEQIVAFGLLSMYLSETGSQADAWIMIGRAIRLGQDVGLHRSPERLRLPSEERNKRRFIWWCLYILERQLSIALGRPLAIDDSDCDVELPSELTDSSKNAQLTGFESFIHLHTILGGILKTVNSVKNANEWRSVEKYEELRSRVRESNLNLQKWAKYRVPKQIKTATTGTMLAERHISLSSYYSAVILLHRVFMPHPHRQSPLESSQAQIRCAKAATDCIHGSSDFLRSVPAGHYHVLHGQNVFVGAIVLMQCIRGSNDQMYTDIALHDVEMALQTLQSLESSWKGARKCKGIVEEYLDLTLQVLQGDYKKGVCNFGHLTEGPSRSISSKKRAPRSSEGQITPQESPAERPPKRQIRADSSPTHRGNTSAYRGFSHEMNAERRLGYTGMPSLPSMLKPAVRLRDTLRTQPDVHSWPSEIDCDPTFHDGFGVCTTAMPQGFTMDNDMLISDLDLDFAPGDLMMPNPQPWAVGDQGMFF